MINIILKFDQQQKASKQARAFVFATFKQQQQQQWMDLKYFPHDI